MGPPCSGCARVQRSARREVVESTTVPPEGGVPGDPKKGRFWRHLVLYKLVGFCADGITALSVFAFRTPRGVRGLEGGVPPPTCKTTGKPQFTDTGGYTPYFDHAGRPTHLDAVPVHASLTLATRRSQFPSFIIIYNFHQTFI